MSESGIYQAVCNNTIQDCLIGPALFRVCSPNNGRSCDKLPFLSSQPRPRHHPHRPSLAKNECAERWS